MQPTKKNEFFCAAKKKKKKKEMSLMEIFVGLCGGIGNLEDGIHGKLVGSGGEREGGQEGFGVLSMGSYGLLIEFSRCVGF